MTANRAPDSNMLPLYMRVGTDSPDVHVDNIDLTAPLADLPGTLRRLFAQAGETAAQLVTPMVQLMPVITAMTERPAPPRATDVCEACGKPVLTAMLGGAPLFLNPVPGAHGEVVLSHDHARIIAMGAHVPAEYQRWQRFTLHAETCRP